MTHDRLTDYEIATSFGDTLSLIYKAKMAEINDELEPTYRFLDSLGTPKYTQWQRESARLVLPTRETMLLNSIDHINKIRGLYKKIKSGTEFINVEKARNTPISKVYDFHFKGKNVSCPFHTDAHPSASIKFNRLICFSCGIKLDSIGLFQKLNSVGFKEAVEALNKI